ncbi:MAG TPA: PAS domain S-box protein [Candidatus Paceibacterota bacterium]|nr:PAS domain S-box protein [Verrucomicrobiota bacterium]HRY49386.1 PAS domain S-box protein [Candidatus Paceibacterota bacterium]
MRLILTAHIGLARTSPPCPRPKSLAIFQQAFRLCAKITSRFGLALWIVLGAFGGEAAVSSPVPLEREAPWRIASFAKDAGVARRMVFDMAFQTNHTAWFAVSDGLYRYDGYRWRRFTTADGLPSSFIRTVAVSPDDSLWVGTDKGAGVFRETTFDPRGTDSKLAGPNVRRIVKTTDGSLWFCCDRWPDTDKTGGLTRLRNGVFRTYGLADGLPSDHVLNLFEQSNGRLIALTLIGPAVQMGETWIPLPDGGYPPNDHTWSMDETLEGLVFAQGSRAALVLKDQRWTECRDEVFSGTAPLCVTQDGNVIKANKTKTGSVLFTRWNGEAFVKASHEIPSEAIDLHVIKQAPDGSIWAVGRGTILRWEYLPGLWEWRPDLPPPILEDEKHRLWFGDQSGVVVMTEEQVQRIPEMRPPLILDRRNTVWSAGHTNLIRWTDGRIDIIPESLCGITSLTVGASDSTGRIWFYGLDSKGADVIAGFDGEKWTVFNLDSLPDRDLSSFAVDSVSGVWGVLIDRQTWAYDIVRVSTNGARIIEVGGTKPQVRLPEVCVSRSNLYLFGYSGLWESPLREPLTFTPVQTKEGGVFSQASSVGDATVFIAHESPDGNAAVLVNRNQEWFRHPITYGQALRLNPDGWLMVADGAEFVLWQAREWNIPTYVGLPTDTTITSMLRTSRGDFWVGTYQGVMRLRSTPVFPETVITGPGTVLEGTPAAIQASAMAPFTPLAKNRRYSFSWRIDSAPWSDFGDWPLAGVPLGQVPPGRHHFEARARDGLGNEDPTPAQMTFEVVPIPIQDQIWFRAVLGGIGLLLALLSIALYGAIRRIRRHAIVLKAQVEARTAELRKDIAARQRAEENLRSSEGLLRSIIDSTDSIIWVKDLEGRFLIVNQYLQKLHNLTPNQILGRTVHDLFPRDLAEAYARNDRQVLESGRLQRFDEVVRVPSGTRDILAVKFPLRDASGQISGLAAICTDITDRKESEADRERLMLAIEQAAETILITDAQGIIRYVNRAFERTTGYSRAEAIGRNPRILKSGKHDDAFYRDLWQTLRRGESWVGRFINRKKDGNLFIEEATISPVKDPSGQTINFVASKRDVTQEIKLEEQLLQAQKMESIGRLAGGVAHDFNNMLQAILGNVDLALKQVPARSHLREDLEEIQKAAQRSADLTRQLLAFARKQTISPKVLDLNDTISGMLKMLQRLIGEDIQLAWLPGSGLWPVLVDPSQIDQVLANLAVNARDAISQEGKITIETQNVTLDSAYAHTHADASPGDYVLLAMSDNGCGMDLQTQEHLFEPFFTTKPVGEGTGLGLATIYGIVKQNNGLISVYSESGRGTTFKIYLPRARALPTPAAVVPEEKPLRGTETVLLVEDEEQILNLGRRILEQHGYFILHAATPQKALELAARHPGPIHLLITDVVMPGMNGKELLRRLQESHPGLKCIFMSGYTANVIAHHGILDADVEFLQKPFTVRALALKVRNVLEQPPHSPS